MYMPTGRGPERVEEELTDRHCWGCWSLKTAGYFVAVVETCFLLYMLIYSIVIWTQGGSAHLDPFIVTVVFVILSGILIVLLVMGITGSKHFLLIPHIIAQVLAIIMFFILVILCIVALTGGDANLQYVINVSQVNQDYPGWNRGSQNRYNQYNRGSDRYGRYPGLNDRRIPTELHGWIIWKLILFLIMGILEIWFLLIIYALYRYIKARSDLKKGDEDNRIYATPHRPAEPYYQKQENFEQYPPLMPQPTPTPPQNFTYTSQSVLYQANQNQQQQGYPEPYTEPQRMTPSPRPEISFRPIQPPVQAPRPIPHRPTQLEFDDDPRFMTRPSPSPAPRFSTNI